MFPNTASRSENDLNELADQQRQLIAQNALTLGFGADSSSYPNAQEQNRADLGEESARNEHMGVSNVPFETDKGHQIDTRRSISEMNHFVSDMLNRAEHNNGSEQAVIEQILEKRHEELQASMSPISPTLAQILADDEEEDVEASSKSLLSGAIVPRAHSDTTKASLSSSPPLKLEDASPTRTATPATQVSTPATQFSTPQEYRGRRIRDRTTGKISTPGFGTPLGAHHVMTTKNEAPPRVTKPKAKVAKPKAPKVSPALAPQILNPRFNVSANRPINSPSTLPAPTQPQSTVGTSRRPPYYTPTSQNPYPSPPAPKLDHKTPSISTGTPYHLLPASQPQPVSIPYYPPPATQPQWCTSIFCPMRHTHPAGPYLHRGQLSRTANPRWGFSDPPPEVWYAWVRVQRGVAEPFEAMAVDGFVGAHAWGRGLRL